MRESFSVDYARRIHAEDRDMSFAERWRAIRATDEYKMRVFMARTRGKWVGIVGLTPWGLLAGVKAFTPILDGHDNLWIAYPLMLAFNVTSMVIGWRVGTARAERELLQRNKVPAPRPLLPLMAGSDLHDRELADRSSVQ